MEELPNDKILEFHPDTLVALRSLYELDKPGRMDEAIDILVEWVKKQNHFMKKDFSREYLERVIITTKGSVERAKNRLDKVCTLRGLLPQYFQEFDVKNDLKLVYHNALLNAALPHLTEDNYRVIFIKIFENFDSKRLPEYYKLLVVMSEYLLAHDYATGIIYVLDYTEVNLLSYAAGMNIMETRNVANLLMEGYGVRIKGLHILTPSKAVDALVMILKQILNEKVSSRIAVHKDLESLHNKVSKELLPSEYGGAQGPLKELHDKWLEVLSSEEHTKYQMEMNKARTDESKRQKDKFNDQYLGMPGSFRSLSVD